MNHLILIIFLMSLDHISYQFFLIHAYTDTVLTLPYTELRIILDLPINKIFDSIFLNYTPTSLSRAL